jgi:putative spermidine/putrescine transport system permease protein
MAITGRLHGGAAVAGPNAARLAALGRREVLGRSALALPALLLVLGCLVAPLAWLLWQSFIGPQGWTLDHYRVAIERPAYLGFLATTVQLSVLTTLFCIVLAYPACYAMVVLRPAFAGVVLVCVVCSFFASYLVRTYAWLLLLQRRGIINNFLMDQGWIEQPLRLVYNVEGTLLGMVHILLPLMILPLYASMKSVDRTLVHAAAALGAPPARAFRDVFLPLSLPGLVAGAVLVFILSLGFYLTPAMLGGGRVVVWATAVATAAEENPVWGAASALGIILLVLTLSLLYALKRLFQIDRVLAKA